MPASAKKARRGYKLTPCGEIPQDWECVPLGQLCREISERGGDDLPALSVTKYNGFVSSLDYFDRQVFSRDTSNYKVVRRGQFAYATIHLDEGSLGLLREHEAGLISPMYTVFALQARGSSEYLYSLLKSAPYLRRYQSLGQGTVDRRKSIPFPTLAQMHVHWPSSQEQNAIAEILSDADTAIASAKNALDQRRNLKFLTLCRLIERGTSPKPKLGKRVGVTSWRFPSSWSLVPLADVADVSSGVTLGRQLSGDDVVELPYLRVANVQDGHLDLSDLKTVQVRRAELPRFLLQPGDVLMNEGGDFDKLGRGAVWRSEVPECLHQNHVFKVRANRARLLPEFLAVVCESAYGKHFFRSNAKQTTNLASINSSQLKEFIIPLPALDEQRRIVEHLDHWTAAIAAEERKLAALERVKAELARRLLTGELRVKS